MRIPDEQLALFQTRLWPSGSAAATSSRSWAPWRPSAASASPPRPGPPSRATPLPATSCQGPDLAVRRRRVVPERSGQPRFQQGPVIARGAALWAGLMVFDADFVSVPWMASKVQSNKDGSVWTFSIRRTRAGPTTPGHRARLRVVVQAPADPPRRPRTPRSSTTSRTARPSTRSRSRMRARSA